MRQIPHQRDGKESEGRSSTSGRRGVAIAEAAIVLAVFLTLLIGSIDLALLVLRDNTSAEAARRLARAAIVRGQSSAAIARPWGPQEYSGSAAAETDYAAAIRDILVTVDPADVRITLSWPDGGNSPGDRVQAVVSTQYQPIVASLLGCDPYLLSATSVMQIEH